MGMEYKSYRTEIEVAMKLCKHEFCEGVGTLVVGEAQSICPVGTDYKDHHKGNLRRSIVSEVMPDDKGVIVGVTPNAPYGLTIEKGLANHKAQPFLEPGAVNSIPKIINVARKHYDHMNGGG